VNTKGELNKERRRNKEGRKIEVFAIVIPPHVGIVDYSNYLFTPDLLLRLTGQNGTNSSEGDNSFE
jgi:hypothetical protein